MRKKNEEIIEYVLKQYIDLYDKKEVLNNKYFKAKKEDVLDIVNSLNKIIEIEDYEKKVKTKKTSDLSDNIVTIKTEEDVEKYYFNNLIYKHGDEKERKNVLKHISAVELKYLYNILYKTELRGRVNKLQILVGIEKYFENKNRALYLKGV